MTLDQRLDRNLARMTKRAPYFAAEYQAARDLLRTAHVGAGIVKFAGGIQCDAEGCTGASCRRVVCLHALGWQMYAGEGVVKHEVELS